jgi:hypothetical protein
VSAAKFHFHHYPRPQVRCKQRVSEVIALAPDLLQWRVSSSGGHMPLADIVSWLGAAGIGHLRVFEVKRYTDCSM